MKSARVLMARNSKKNGSQDFLETPVWATEILFKHEMFFTPIWEPACGAGKMSRVIAKRTGEKVYSSDKYDHGYGHTGSRYDFLLAPKLIMPSIITNPPNNILNKFMKKALDFQPQKLALFCRTLSLGSRARYKIYKQYTPSKVIVITDRVMFDGSEEPGGYWEFSWYIWKLSYKGPTILEFASFYD